MSKKFPANQSHFKALHHYHFEEGFFAPSSPKVQNRESLGFQRPAKKLFPLKKKGRCDYWMFASKQEFHMIPLERLSDKATSHASNQINWASRTLLSGSCHLTTPDFRCKKKTPVIFVVLTHHFIAWKYPRQCWGDSIGSCKVKNIEVLRFTSNDRLIDTDTPKTKTGATSPCKKERFHIPPPPQKKNPRKSPIKYPEQIAKALINFFLSKNPGILKCQVNSGTGPDLVTWFQPI